MPFSGLSVLAALAPPAVVLAIARLAHAFETRRERRRHARILEGLGTPLAGPDLAAAAPGALVTLDGRVAAESPRVVSFHPYGSSLLDEANAYAVTHLPGDRPLVVELDGGRAVVEGDVQVLVGSEETEHGASIDVARTFEAEPLVAAAGRRRVGQFRAVGPGDRVRIRGLASPAPDDDAHYRERGTTVRVVPETVRAPGAPAAVSFAALASTRRPTKSTLLPPALVAAIALGAAGATVVATRAPASAPPAREVTTTAPAVKTEPACRKDVIAAVEKSDPRATELAKACEDPLARAFAAFAEGDFQDASDAFDAARTQDPSLVPSLAEAEAHLFVHQDARVAKTVRSMLDAFYPGPSTSEKRYLECIAAALDARAAGDKRHPRCSTRPFAKLARALEPGGFGTEEDDTWPDYGPKGFLDGLRYDAVRVPAVAAVAPRSRVQGRPVGLEKKLLDQFVVPVEPSQHPYGRLTDSYPPRDDVYALLTGFAADLTLFYAFTGFTERAKPYWPVLDRTASILEKEGASYQEPLDAELIRTWDRASIAEAQAAREKAIAKERTMLEFVVSVGAAAALTAGDLARVDRYTKVGEVHGAHVVKQLRDTLEPGAAWEEPAEDGHWPERRAVFDAAGDGARVVELLVAQGSTGRDVLPRVLPRITTNRSALDRWYEGRYPAGCVTCGASAWLGHLSDRREVGRLLGGAAANEHARLLPSAERFVDALTDRETAFEVDELETFFGSRR